jgi:hypothetical protein
MLAIRDIYIILLIFLPLYTYIIKNKTLTVLFLCIMMLTVLISSTPASLSIIEQVKPKKTIVYWKRFQDYETIISFSQPFTTQTRFYPYRIAGGGRDYCRVGGDSASGVEFGAGTGAGDSMYG